MSMEYKGYKEIIMQECTFKPNIDQTSKEVPTTTKPKKINGYDEIIQRMRNVTEEKRKNQEKIDK